MPGTDPPRCSSHLGLAGRRTLLTEELTAKLVEAMEAGNAISTALVFVGVPQSTFYEWLDRGNPDGRKKVDAPYRDFRRQVEEAKEKGIARNLITISDAAKRDWRAAKALLELTAPETFTRTGRTIRARNQETSEVDDGEQTGATGDEDADPFTTLPGDELAERRAASGGASA